MPRSRRLSIVLPTGVLPFLRYLGANAEERPVVWANVANATVAVSAAAENKRIGDDNRQLTTVR